MSLTQHQQVLRDHLAEGLSGTGESIDPKTFSIYSRAFREGLQRTALSVGGDPDISDEDKGKWLSMLSLMNGALEGAFEIQAIRESTASTSTIRPLSR